jgi:hypothetical protein
MNWIKQSRNSHFWKNKLRANKGNWKQRQISTQQIKSNYNKRKLGTEPNLKNIRQMKMSWKWMWISKQQSKRNSNKKRVHKKSMRNSYKKERTNSNKGAVNYRNQLKNMTQRKRNTTQKRRNSKQKKMISVLKIRSWRKKRMNTRRKQKS